MLADINIGIYTICPSRVQFLVLGIAACANGVKRDKLIINGWYVGDWEKCTFRGLSATFNPAVELHRMLSFPPWPKDGIGTCRMGFMIRGVPMRIRYPRVLKGQYASVLPGLPPRACRIAQCATYVHLLYVRNKVNTIRMHLPEMISPTVFTQHLKPKCLMYQG